MNIKTYSMRAEAEHSAIKVFINEETLVNIGQYHAFLNWPLLLELADIYKNGEITYAGE